LEFLLDHLRWSLEQPLRHGERDWATRVGRALERVAKVFDDHVEQTEGPGGLLTEVADACLLPFTAEAQQAATVRRQHESLRTKVRCVASQFRDALGLFPPQDDGARVATTDIDEVQEMRALRLFRALDPCVGDILAELDACLSAERSLLEAQAAENGKRLSMPRAGRRPPRGSRPD
jgi:hypothetical protein